MVYTSEYKVSTKTECNVFEGASTLGFLTAKAQHQIPGIYHRRCKTFFINKQIRGMKGIYREQKKERRKKER